MKKLPLLLSFIIFILGCDDPRQRQKLSTYQDPVDWLGQKVQVPQKDSLEDGKSYLSIYSQIYSPSEKTTHNLTAMVSLRNTSEQDAIFLMRAVYFDSDGQPIRSYLDHPVSFKPLETKEIVIDQSDVQGGTGSNFIFEWKIPKDCPEPLFEGIMSSTVGPKGLSLTTQSKRIK